MITKRGKTLIAKFLIGQAPSFASHLALGCGPKPLGQSESYSPSLMQEMSNKEVLDFEVFRVPILSRGFVSENVLDENGDIVIDEETGEVVKESRVVLTAELPTDERYEITEIGTFSAAANPSAGNIDSRNLYSFASSENWEYHDLSSAESIAFHRFPLDQDDAGSIPDGASANSINVGRPAFFAAADNATLDSQIRTSRFERGRYLNSMLFLSGDSASVYGADESLFIETDPESEDYDPRHIHLTGVRVNLDRAASSDELRLAFSVVNKNLDSANPSDVKIIIDFSTPEGLDLQGQEYARFSAHYRSSENDFSNNRYFVASRSLSSLEKTPAFSWDAVSIVKVYASVIENGEFSDNFFVALDSLRFENRSSVNPLYALTGYTRVKTDSGLPIVKAPNTSNLVEFRFGIEVE